MEARLEFFPVEVELATKRLDGMRLVQIRVEVCPDILYQLNILSLHISERFTLLSRSKH